MLSPQLRRKVQDLWSLFWSSGLSNPLVAIEQITYLLFIRQLESLDRERIKVGKKSIYTADPNDSTDFTQCRWSYIRKHPSFESLEQVVFPWLRGLEQKVNSGSEDETLRKISNRLADAHFILDPNKTETLKRAIEIIDELFRQLDTRSVNADIMGDVFEYLLEEVKESGKNGQFRTPRHVIRFMVELLDPHLGRLVLDPACGSGGFLLNTLTHWKAEHTPSDILRLEWDGAPNNVEPVWPKGADSDFSSKLRGYDNDRTMVRIAWMNLILHGVESPEVNQLDTLSKRLSSDESDTYDYILANPPFTGSVDEGDLSENRERFPGTAKKPLTTKSELLYVWLMLDLLRIGGRAAVVVPDGVLFGATTAHRELRRQLLFENVLEAVVSLPANVFQPYSGVKTSILVFQKAADKAVIDIEPRTKEVWFYEVVDEAYSLDQKRKARPGEDNDFWDALAKFHAWKKYQRDESNSDRGSRAANRERATGRTYYQPDYWQERWRTVDDDLLKVFPEKSRYKGQVLALHELWPKDFPFNPKDPLGSRQYEQMILKRVTPRFERAFHKLTTWSISHALGRAVTGNPEELIPVVERNARTLGNQILRTARPLLDREFDQFGQNALKVLLKDMSAKATEWTKELSSQTKKPKRAIKKPTIEPIATSLKSLLKEFAKLDGFNIWRRGIEVKDKGGKLMTSGNGRRDKTALSWIVPVRKWLTLESWGEDPETNEIIAKPTHDDGVVRLDYLMWLRDRLQVFGPGGTVKKAFLDRLDPDCLEALDFNLLAGRHKPFTLELGEHRDPAEVVRELQSNYSEAQARLQSLLTFLEAKG